MTQKRKIGRPFNSGLYGEKTVPIRVPVSLKEKILDYIKKLKGKK